MSDGCAVLEYSFETWENGDGPKPDARNIRPGLTLNRIGLDRRAAMQSNRTCSVAECGRIHYARSFCRKHYERSMKHGDPLTIERRVDAHYDDIAGIEWRPIDGFAGRYEVSEFGNVRNVTTGRLLTGKTRDRYIKYCLSDGDSEVYEYAHRLVAAAFLGTPTGPLVRHLDDDGRNNHYSNLAYGTSKNNYDDAVRNGRQGPGVRTRTHCVKGGHELKGENLYTSPAGHRICRQCRRDWDARRGMSSE